MNTFAVISIIIIVVAVVLFIGYGLMMGGD